MLVSRRIRKVFFAEMGRANTQWRNSDNRAPWGFFRGQERNIQKQNGTASSPRRIFFTSVGEQKIINNVKHNDKLLLAPSRRGNPDDTPKTV